MRTLLYILGDLDDTDIAWLARTGARRELAPGEVLIAAGVPPSDLFFVTGGMLGVTAPDGRRVATLNVGDVVGEMSFVEKRAPGATVAALDPSRVLAVPRAAILEAFAADQGFAARFYRALAVFLSDRLRGATGADDRAGPDDAGLDTPGAAGTRFARLIALLDGRDQ